MKILVCISKAPDTTSRIAFTDGDTQFDANGVQFIVNPYDEWYALVRALELKEQQGGSVTIVTVGGADSEPIMRKALAIGADDAVRIDVDPQDALETATLIANHAQGEGYDLILCGKGNHRSQRIRGWCDGGRVDGHGLRVFGDFPRRGRRAPPRPSAKRVGALKPWKRPCPWW